MSRHQTHRRSTTARPARPTPDPLALAAHLLLAGGIAAACWASPAQAQQAAPAAPGQESHNTRSYSIPAGPLNTVLMRFLSESGVLLSGSTELAQGRNSPGAQGRFTPGAALNALLAGTGLDAVADAQGRYVLRPAAPRPAAPGPESRPAAREAAATATLAETTVKDSALRDGVTEGTGSYTTRSTSAATGLNLSLRETPQSVTVVTRERMDDQALDSLGQVLAQTPGVSFIPQGAALGAFEDAFARGYRVNSYQMDGVATPSDAWSANGTTGAASLDTAIYDSATVVRGATGLLTGAGDPSASISLTRKRPTDKFQASVAQSLGRWNQHRTVGDVGGPLNAAGSLRGRLVAAYDGGESWIDRYDGHKSVAYGVLEADLSDRTLLSLALEHARETGNSAGSYTGFDLAFTDGSRTPFSRSDNAVADWSAYHTKRTTVSAALEHRFNDDWRAKLSYNHSQRDSNHKLGYPNTAPDPDGMANIMLRSVAQQNRVDVLDAKLSGRYTLWGRQHDLAAGFYASETDVKYPHSLTIWDGGRVQVLGWTGNYPEPDWSAHTANTTGTRTRQSGAYLATRLRATDDLSFILGARWSNWQTHTRNLNTGLTTDDRKEKNVLTPYVGVVYDLTKQLSAYASYTAIFNPQSFRDVNNNVLDPEKGKNLEVGLKGEWFNGRLNASAAVFQSGKDNVAVTDFVTRTPSGALAWRAEDDTKARGWELEVAGELAPGWHLQGGYTRVLLKDRSGEVLNADVQPKHQFKLFTTWTPASLSRLTLGGGVLWQSERSSTLNPARSHIYTQKSYAVVNLMASYRFSDHLSLAVQLNNAFDKTYRTMPNQHVYGAPRSLYATLKYKF